MKTLIKQFALPIALLLAVSTARAQDWTPAEQEVIDFIDNCQRMWREVDYDTWFTACWDEDIIVVDPEMSPASKIDRAYERGLHLSGRIGVREVHRQMTPMSVKVFGDTAVIYYFLSVFRLSDDGSRIGPVSNSLRSETVIKRDGAWKVINFNYWPYPPASEDD